MTTPLISLWEAYQVETLRSKGLSDDRLIKALKEKDLDVLKATDYSDAFDYQELIDAADKDMDTFEQAIRSDYRIKYLSIYGIKNLLKLKYGLEDGTDYEMTENRFDGLKLTEEQISEFQTLASTQWRLIETKDDEGNSTISIRHLMELDNHC